jgi:hypothetical protein
MSLKKISLLIITSIILLTTISLQAQNFTQKNKITSRQYKVNNDKDKWEVEVNYPELKLKNKEIALDFNEISKALVMRQVAEFKKIFLNEKNNSDTAYDLSISYSIEYQNENIVSVLFFGREYTGGAHGNSWSFVLNYDLKNNRQLVLSDLFNKGNDFLTIMSKQSIAQILNEQGSDAVKEWVEGGAGKNIENFKSWSITKKGLKFTFDPYQVASYVNGSSTTQIPFKVFNLNVTFINLFSDK